MRAIPTRMPILFPVVLGIVALATIRSARTAVLVVEARPDATYPTIQSAVNAAIPIQDDVFVTCGRYNENVVMRNGVDVRGANPRCAILQGLGGASGPAVRFPSLSTPTELSGLTIRGGASQPAVRGDGGSPRIIGNVIENGSHGILISAFLDPANPVISRDVIRNNVDGGIRVEAAVPASSPVITSNLIVGSGLGVELLTYSTSLMVANNTIVRNPAGGIVVYAEGSPNTIVANNVVAWNDGGGGIRFWGFQTPEIVQNDVWSNSPWNFDVSTGDPSASNFSADPQFVNEVRDFTGYEPRSYSPLVDIALPALAPAQDLRSVRRVSGRGCFSGPDVGARENEGITGFGESFPVWWDPVPGPCIVYGPEYQVLRGDLAVLRATGVYRQDSEVPAAAQWCEQWPGAFWDPEVPERGEAFFYLVTGWNDCESPLGFTSAGTLRPGSVCWSSCEVGPALENPGVGAQVVVHEGLP